jgi:hypothetical protein
MNPQQSAPAETTVAADQDAGSRSSVTRVARRAGHGAALFFRCLGWSVLWTWAFFGATVAGTAFAAGHPTRTIAIDGAAAAGWLRSRFVLVWIVVAVVMGLHRLIRSLPTRNSAAGPDDSSEAPS